MGSRFQTRRARARYRPEPSQPLKERQQGLRKLPSFHEKQRPRMLLWPPSRCCASGERGWIKEPVAAGGQVTRMFFDFPEFGKKWLELLKEVLPRFAKIAVLRDPATGPVQIKAVDSAGKLLNVKLEILEVRGAANLNDSIVAAGGKGMDALLMTSSPPAVGATLHYLPQYSPDLNPIEMVFHPLRAYLRKAAERTIRGVARQIRVHSNHPHREFMEYCRRAGYAPL